MRSAQRDKHGAFEGFKGTIVYACASVLPLKDIHGFICVTNGDQLTVNREGN